MFCMLYPNHDWNLPHVTLKRARLRAKFVLDGSNTSGSIGGARLSAL